MKYSLIFVLLFILSACSWDFWNVTESEYLKIVNSNHEEKIFTDEIIVPVVIAEFQDLKGTFYPVMSCHIENENKYSISYYSNKQLSKEFVIQGSDCDGGGYVINNEVFISSKNEGKILYNYLNVKILD